MDPISTREDDGKTKMLYHNAPHLSKEVWISDDNKKGLGTANCHIEPLGVGQESKVTFHVLREKLIG